MKRSELVTLLDYNPATGEFRWRDTGKLAGSKNNRGYWKIGILGKRGVLAHRLAWVLYYGYWPEGNLDHIDGDRLNNKIDNLRIATPSQNGMNSKTPSNNTSGQKGVMWEKDRKKWAVQIRTNGKLKRFGRFKNFEDAVAAYQVAVEQMHGDYRRTK